MNPPKKKKMSKKDKRRVQIDLDLEHNYAHWQPLIDEELEVIPLLGALLLAKVKSVVDSSDESTETKQKLFGDSNSWVRRQSCIAFHHLYRHGLNRIVVENTNEEQINGRIGTIVRHDANSKNDQVGFQVMLSCEKHPVPTIHSGYKRFLESQFLKPTRTRSTDTFLPGLFDATYVYSTRDSELVQMIVRIEKQMVEDLRETMQAESDYSHLSDMAQSIIRAYDRNTMTDRGSEVDLSIQCDPPTDCNDMDIDIDNTAPSRNERHNAIGTFEDLHSLYSNSPARRVHVEGCKVDGVQGSSKCPAHGNNSCQEPTNEAACPVDLNAVDYPLELIMQPDDRLFSVPFSTTNSILPSAALGLNELNVTKSIGRVIPEGAIMSRMSKYFRGIMNRDLYSLFPNSNISHNITDMWTSW